MLKKATKSREKLENTIIDFLQRLSTQIYLNILKYQIWFDFIEIPFLTWSYSFIEVNTGWNVPTFSAELRGTNPDNKMVRKGRFHYK